nr:hypothetical protein CFP56_58197 [Quercus suber]
MPHCDGEKRAEQESADGQGSGLSLYQFTVHETSRRPGTSPSPPFFPPRSPGPSRARGRPSRRPLPESTHHAADPPLLAAGFERHHRCQRVPVLQHLGALQIDLPGPALGKADVVEAVAQTHAADLQFERGPEAAQGQRRARPTAGALLAGREACRVGERDGRPAEALLVGDGAHRAAGEDAARRALEGLRAHQRQRDGGDAAHHGLRARVDARDVRRHERDGPDQARGRGEQDEAAEGHEDGRDDAQQAHEGEQRFAAVRGLVREVQLDRLVGADGQQRGGGDGEEGGGDRGGALNSEGDGGGLGLVGRAESGVAPLRCLQRGNVLAKVRRDVNVREVDVPKKKCRHSRGPRPAGRLDTDADIPNICENKVLPPDTTALLLGLRSMRWKSAGHLMPCKQQPK